ncbi:MAG: exodeoxyribonuclease V subunit beta [Burkholderiales bacterium]|nr:exodeoxyribonuclease V subunit beta [Burkholderiales bacterium]
MAEPDFAPLDFATAPLAGTVLVEASAGTGKTWTIAALVVRLVLEKRYGEAPCRIEEILVLTYTKAATAELRERILARLVEVREGFAAGAAADPVIRHALAVAGDRRDEAIVRLDAAITSFDLAPIHTIHGFCQRALADHAFESAMPFATEIVEDELTFREAAARDFWRRAVAGADPQRAAELVARFKGPGGLLAAAKPALDRPYAELLGVAGEPDLDVARARVAGAFAAAAAAWPRAKAAVAKAVAGAKLNATSYPPRKLDEWWPMLDAYFAAGDPSGERGKLAKLVPAELAKGKTKAGTVPEHPFFALAAAVVEALAALDEARAAADTFFVQRFCEWCRAETARAKRSRGVQGYDDLLAGLRGALAGEGGEALAAALRSRYRAALIDEFQDTDPVQAEIVRRIWHGQEGPLYFVGDPKQAIYGFRGADVFAYLDARRLARRPALTLDVNQRADAPLLHAVEALFADPASFLIPDIRLVPVRPADRPRPRFVATDGVQPFTVWHFAGADGLDKKAVRARIAAAVAGDIARLLAQARAGGARIEPPGGNAKPLAGGDIAVLVGTHDEGDLIRAALARRGIASVTYGADSVFASREAIDMERVLLAVAEPGREAFLRAALVTDFFGLDAAALAALGADGDAWEERVARFRGYHDLAVAGGFVRMWRELAAREGVPARLLAHPDGERRMTNVAHLVELLHRRADEEGLDLAELARFLAHARAAPMRDPDAEQLRLESDEHLVNIVTVHRAKGLEFPVVYCPFLWDGLQRSDRGGSVVFHAAADGHRTFVDVGSPDRDRHQRIAAEEALAAELRLAYVALTRARHRTTVVWGKLPDAGTSALGWLLHPPADRAEPVAAAKEAFKSVDDAAIAARLAALGRAARGAIGVVPLPAEAGGASAESGDVVGPPPLAARPAPRRIAHAWRLSSFSGLVSRGQADGPDHDPLGAVVAPRRETQSRDAFGLPRGVRFGTLLHRVLETLDFRGADAARIGAAVDRELPRSGIDAAWAPAIVALVADTLATPLDAGGFALAALARERRLDELEFTYPVGGAAAADLARILTPLRARGSRLPEAIGPLVLAPERGFMRGYIDLVFERDGRYCLADYKSNWLGDALADYAPARLDAAMAAAFYDLQYLLYTVALHRFLASRLAGYDYDEHFGGVYYLFVRGMRPERGPASGVWFARPERALVEALDAALAPAGPLVDRGEA